MEFVVSESRVYELEMNKISALARRDAFDYYHSCNALNVVPEEQKLYDDGLEEDRFRRGVFEKWRDELAENKMAENDSDILLMRKVEEWKRDAKDRRFLVFYESAIGISLGLEDETERKMQLLGDFDPERYGLDRSQSFNDRNYKPEEIGGIFERVFRVAEKKFKLNGGRVK
jgi:hypothetical protein